ncbi:hypothetical protein AALP_AA8G357600 [Arabis alpina]|uniref:Uncharacterized protein n=1 Tax=Arabis alpina TaxID=50452 RepID=A0A087GBK0_ARAAL|nr:hypothetical protein AALP_AA8G357600 [Arabis alpina]
MRPDVLRVTDVTTGPNITRVPDVSGCHGLMFPPCTDDPSRVTVTEDPLPHLRTEEARGSDVGRGTDLDDPGRHTDVSRTRDPNDLFVYPEGPTRVVTDEEDLASSSRWASSSRRARDPRASFGSFEDGMIPLNDEDPELPFGNAFASSSSSSLDSRASSVERDDEDIVDEVEQTKKAASTQRVKPKLPEVSTKFVKAMHKEVSSGNFNCKESFSRKRIKRAFSAKIILGKILGRGKTRVSSREQAALVAAAKAARSSGTDAPRAVVPITLTLTAVSAPARSSRPLAPKTPATSTLLPPPSLSSGELVEFHKMSAERARISSGNGKGINCEPPSKKRRVDTSPAAIADREASASGIALPLLSFLFDGLVGDYDEDVRFRESELRVAKVANAALQSRLDELTERNLVVEHDASSVQKIRKDYDAKLAKLNLKCSKGDEEIASLKTLLSSASDLQSSRIGEAVAASRGEMIRGFAGRVSEVVGLLVEIGGKVQNNMLNLAEIDANLEFIGLLRGSSPPDLQLEIRALHERHRLIYDAQAVFRELLDRVREILKIPKVSAADEVDDAVDDEAFDEVDDEADDEADEEP